MLIIIRIRNQNGNLNKFHVKLIKQCKTTFMIITQDFDALDKKLNEFANEIIY